MSAEDPSFPATMADAIKQTDLACYGYREYNKEYAGDTVGDISPEDFKLGEIHIAWPKNTTRIKPPPIPAGQAAVFDVQAQSWSLVPDHRFQTWFDGRQPVEIMELGDPAAFDPPLTPEAAPEPPPEAQPVRAVLDYQFAGQAAADGIISDDDALAWVASGKTPANLIAAVRQVVTDPDRQKRVILFLAGTTIFPRDHELTPLLAASFGIKTPEALDAFFQAASRR